MDAVLLQDFTTARASNASPSIIQSAHAWVDLGDYEDIQISTDIRAVTGALSLKFETSPTRDENAFTSLFPAFTVATGTRTDLVPTFLASVAPARFLRWNLTLTAGASGDATFRIWIAAYALGVSS